MKTTHKTADIFKKEGNKNPQIHIRRSVFVLMYVYSEFHESRKRREAVNVSYRDRYKGVPLYLFNKLNTRLYPNVNPLRQNFAFLKITQNNIYLMTGLFLIHI